MHMVGRQERDARQPAQLMQMLQTREIVIGVKRADGEGETIAYHVAQGVNRALERRLRESSCRVGIAHHFARFVCKMVGGAHPTLPDAKSGRLQPACLRDARENH